MSTYLIALVVSDFAYISNVDISNGFRHRVFAATNKIQAADLALNDGVRVLKALEHYLQVNYTLPKMDQVALPAFEGGTTIQRH